MPQMIVRVDGRGDEFSDVLQEKQILNIPESIPIRVCTLDRGMASGEPSVAFLLELPKEIPRTVVIAQTSMKLFQIAAATVYGKYGDRSGGAFTASMEKGKVTLTTSEEVSCSHCKTWIPSHVNYCFECGAEQAKRGASGVGKTETLPMVPVVLTKKSNDPQNITRVSIGGDGSQYYCTYRGSRRDTLRAIKHVLREMVDMNEEPPISPDDGKRYA